MGEWWKEQVVYQIYPRSFQDSNGDGVGDIQGIISRLDYLEWLGIDTLWLSPVYCSPNEDNGYDISDYIGINPEYGTMRDMDTLIAEAKRHGIKIIMDLVINHTSCEHKWFQKSRKQIEPYTDYYIWKKGGPNGEKPNNWTSFFAEDCWEFDEERGEYYLHLFAKHQPDLNYNNPKVIEEIKEILRFWLDKGIAGFRCDVINILYKTSLENGKKKLILTGSENYISQEGTHRILRELNREVLSKYDCFTVGETVFVDPQMARDLSDMERGELDMLFAFEHMESDQFIVKWFKRKFSPERFVKTLVKWQNELRWNANYLENHDQPRSVSRFGDSTAYWDKSAKLLAMLLLTLKGTPYMFEGEEIGMTNFDFASMDDVRDVESINVERMMQKTFHFSKKRRWSMIKKTSRDNARTPMQWNSTDSGGFTTGEPWLRVNSNYRRINVAAQKGDPDSVLNFYRELLSLRKARKVLRLGDFNAVQTSEVFVYDRVLKTETLTIALNFSKKKKTLKMNGELVLSNYSRDCFDGTLSPYEAVIFERKAEK
ncbi:MAG: alpha-glucosidase [Oscillospiraceae bacterium]